MEPLGQRTSLETNAGDGKAKVVEKSDQCVGVGVDLGFLHDLAIGVDDAHAG
jgi:hypothetical protein